MASYQEISLVSTGELNRWTERSAVIPCPLWPCRPTWTTKNGPPQEETCLFPNIQPRWQATWLRRDLWVMDFLNTLRCVIFIIKIYAFVMPRRRKDKCLLYSYITNIKIMCAPKGYNGNHRLLILLKNLDFSIVNT